VTLEARDLTVGYNGRDVLQAVSLAVEPGEILVVSGPNGAGKSTLINALSGVIAPTEGSVLLAGKQLASLDDRQRARQIAVVPQGGYLPPVFSVRQVVQLGRTPYLGWLGTPQASDHEVVERVLQELDLSALQERPIARLSGGERQRVLLARALAQDAPILLLDEPTTFLDLRHQSEILSIVGSLAREKGLAILMVLHDLNLAGQSGDRIALLLNGQIRAQGSPAAVMTAENLSEVYGVPVTVLASPKGGGPIILPG
jgi:iron complex transport system ATP-binding protein